MTDHVHIGGLDMSVVSTGYCAPNGLMRTIKPRTPASDPSRRLAEIEQLLTSAIQNYPPIPTLMVVEQYVLGFSPPRPGEDKGPSARASTAFKIGEVGGVMKLVMFKLGIRYVTVSPTSLKKFATGAGKHAKDENGHSTTKTVMLHSATSRLRAVDPDAKPPKNDDEADAWHLRQMGRVALGLDKPWAEWQWTAIEDCGTVFA